MPITFKAPLSSETANNTWLDITVDDAKKGKFTLYKTLITDPDAIDDVQDYINELADVDGVVGESDPNSKTYSSEEIIANGDDRKAAIGKLDAQVKTNLDAIANNTTNIAQGIRATFTNEAISASGTITKSDTITDQVRRVSGDSGAQTASTTPFGNSSTTNDGVLIILRGTDAVNTLTINNSDIQYGCILNGNATLGIYQQIELMYDSILERWVEQKRNF